MCAVTANYDNVRRSEKIFLLNQIIRRIFFFVYYCCCCLVMCCIHMHVYIYIFISHFSFHFISFCYVILPFAIFHTKCVVATANRSVCLVCVLGGRLAQNLITNQIRDGSCQRLCFPLTHCWLAVVLALHEAGCAGCSWSVQRFAVAGLALVLCHHQ